MSYIASLLTHLVPVCVLITIYVKWFTPHFTDLCRYTCIYTHPPPVAPARPPSLRVMCAHNAPIWPAVKANDMPHSTITSKMYIVSAGYLSTTTVMQSVATTCGDKMGRVVTSKMCWEDDAHLYPTPHLRWSLYIQHSTYQHQRCGSLVRHRTYTIYKVYDNYVTLIVAYRSVKPHMSLAHGFRNYVVITATAWETAGAEDHAMRNGLTRLILYSTRL